MSTLIFDIETVGQDWEDLPDSTKNSLTKWLKLGIGSEQDDEKQLDEIKGRLSLSPFTGKIVSLAMYDIERDLGAVYFVADKKSENIKTESFTFKQRTEQEILEEFWEGAGAYDTFVTFNGRAFALPFLYHRSVVGQVRPTVEIAKQRYLTKQSLPYHVDLLDEATFYGAMQKRPSLALLCGAYGIRYRNEEVGGEDVADLFKARKYREIAVRNANDILAIKDLYQHWKHYLAPHSFLNTIEM